MFYRDAHSKSRSSGSKHEEYVRLYVSLSRVDSMMTASNPAPVRQLCRYASGGDPAILQAAG